MADDATLVPDPAEIARLRAEAARAAAEAAKAKAAAAQAALDAALAAAGSGAPAPQAPPPTPAPAPPPSPAAAATATPPITPAGPPTTPTRPPAPAPGPSPAPAASSALKGYAQEVAAGYTFDGLTIPLGALLDDGAPVAGAQVTLPLRMLNRHGLVAGATGTGKTRTLQLLAEELSAAGVPVFLTDIKGDLSGMLEQGRSSEKLLARTRALGQDWSPAAFPVELLSLGGMGTGTPIRTTVTDFGPLLMAKVLGLNDTQESSLQLIFHWADAQGLALLDLKDLRATVAYLTGEGKDELKAIGGISTATAGVILREISALQAQGADVFFGEPAFETTDLLRTAPDGRGVVSALQLPDLQDRPALFSTFVMWLLADLFGSLPEVGDPERPRLVFFFDEAHLLFTGASKEFLTQVVQTVRLIRSKGVGIFFVTQTPKDVPADVLGQLGARVQHALRAFTPEDADALRETVRTFPTSPYDLGGVLTSLGTGEAVVTVLAETGAPTPVAPTRIRAPRSSMGTAAVATIERVVTASPLAARYAVAVDNESAYELLAARVTQQRAAAEAATASAEAAASARERAQQAEKAADKAAKDRERELAKQQAEREREEAKARTASERAARRRSSAFDSLLRSAGTQLGREITRSIFGTRRR
ncbi:helicase HerA-like domain-containing protein [Georgenia sp. SYP-B2076]|uniref:helicase HerA-like domain-containing protein n=1 Tax=Georgenia sp. SYP-B2076 TaxID=2495881 RepID=UPI00197AADE9|nr:helicase HerA-like domain-containing protein [Georgenia sp. SYP-B2076]